MTIRNYYSILGVSPDSEDVVIAAAYKALMRKYHPDKNRSADAHKMATEINEAFETLNDPARRAAYNTKNGFASQSEQNQSEEAPQPRASKDETPDDAAEQTSDTSTWPDQNGWKPSLPQLAAAMLFVALFCLFIVSEQDLSGERNSSEDAVVAATEAASEGGDVLLAHSPLANEPPAESVSPSLLESTGSGGLVLNGGQQMGPAIPLEYRDIESAAYEFDRVLARNGISGAKSYSTKCHAAADKLQDWSKYDFCIAFDLVAAIIDDGVSRQSGFSRNPYFQFMEDNAVDQYPTGSAASYVLNQRVSAIRRGVGPAALEAIQARIAKRRPIKNTPIGSAAELDPLPSKSLVDQLKPPPDASDGKSTRPKQ